MTRRRKAVPRPARPTANPLPPPPAAAAPALPTGPALLYITSTGTTVHVDTQPVADPRERTIYRALAGRAATLAAQADDAEQPAPPGTGNYL